LFIDSTKYAFIDAGVQSQVLDESEELDSKKNTLSLPSVLAMRLMKVDKGSIRSKIVKNK
jgi:hypothetical protein